MWKLYAAFCIFFTSSLIVNAQQNSGKLIDIDFKQANIFQIVTDLKAKTGYQFFYDPAQFDSLKVTLAITQKPVGFILNKLFENTVYHYFITDDQEVILTRNLKISTELPPGFFNENANEVAKNNVVTAYNIEDEKLTAEATTENKLYEIGIKTNSIKKGNVTLEGYVRNIKSGEAVNGAGIYNPETGTKTVTDQFGHYSITLPRGRQTLILKSVGTKDTKRQIILYANGKLNIQLDDRVTALKEVQVSAEKVANVRGVEMGVSKLDIKIIKQVPTVFGEADLLRVVLTLPGVQSVGEATTGFNVRGGSADQNLILLNDATIYNPSHFFGFFSAFNPDIVKSVELYKSDIPEKYGGRLSSVLDVTDREGNKEKYTGSAGIGILTSRLNLEGPIVKDNTSFIFGARTTYSDWLLSLLPAAYHNSSASFYDLNLDINHKIDDKNSISITTYVSNDKFSLNGDTSYAYGNRNANIKWKHNYNNKLYSVFMAGVDDYQYSLTGTANPVNAYKLDFGIRQTNFKADFTYYLNSKNTVDFGLSSIYYNLNPGDDEPYGAKSLVAPEVVEPEQALESALYIGDKYDITSKFSVSAGVRYSLYAYLGPQSVDYYAPNLPKESANVTDSVTYKKNQVINTYKGPEIRLSARYTLGDDESLKASYNTLYQYIHLLSNTTAISPTDTYKLSDPNIKPQFGKQVSLGFYKNLSSNTIETSVEVYYKKIDDYLDYRDGATLLLNQHIEQDVINTQGKAYGIEFPFCAQKTAGLLNGWISYTYSRTFLKTR